MRADFSFDANDVVDVAGESGAESSFPKLNLLPSCMAPIGGIAMRIAVG